MFHHLRSTITHLVDFVVIAEFSFARRHVENFADNFPRRETAYACLSLPTAQNSHHIVHSN